MANTLTGLIPDLHEAADVVSRELVGFIPAVRMDAGVERAAVNQDVIAFKTPSAVSQNITPAITPPDAGDQTIGNVAVTITKAKGVPVRWNGEEQRGVNTGPGYQAILVDQFAQAMRTLVNEVETDLALEAKARASRAFGVAGTAPFATAGDYSDSAEAWKILVDNGTPKSDLHLVLGTPAGTNIRGKQGGRGVNLEGTDAILRQGILQDISGFSIRESAAAGLHTIGTGTGYLVNNAPGYAVGDTVIALDTGTGTIVGGDVVTFTGDTNKYIVVSALSGGSITIGAPGLRQTLANNVAASVGAAYSQNSAFRRSAIILAARLPALPEEGDAAADRYTVVDPRSGLAFEVAMYAQFRQIQYWVSLAWGVKGIKEEHIATLLG